jgi:trehalose 6-phosphate synthase
VTSLVIAANRAPVTLATDDSGNVIGRHAAGGLAPSLAEALRGKDGIVVAAPMSDAERKAAASGWPASVTTPCPIRLVDLPAETTNAAYRTISNETLWFVYHGLFEQARRPLLDAAFHQAFAQYRRYNEAFAEAIAEEADAGATVLVNDYHLALVGAHLAAHRPDLHTVHFTHTPFATPEELRILSPEIARELLVGMAGFGACGFHTERWADRFVRCAETFGVEASTVFAVPLGTDAVRLRDRASTDAVRERRGELLESIGDRRLIVRSDRIELSKNLLRGFLAFAELLETQPQWRGEVVFVARTYASRQDLEAYVAYRAELDQVVADVNARFGAPGYVPIRFEVADDFEATLAALTAYEVLLVNPIRDGLNLVAKEGPAVNERDGVVVLSTEAGAFSELAEAVIAVSPFDVSATARALAEALEMDGETRQERAAALRSIVDASTAGSWFEAVISQAQPPER